MKSLETAKEETRADDRPKTAINEDKEKDKAKEDKLEEPETRNEDGSAVNAADEMS